MRIKILILIILPVALFSFPVSGDTDMAVIPEQMSLEDKIGQMMMTGIAGKEAGTGNYNAIIRKYKLGGVILFGYNIAEAGKLKKFTASMQSVSLKSSGIPLFITTDQECGLVVRIKDGVTQFPGAVAAGSADEPELTEKMAYHLGLQMKNLGFNMNLAPVADINNNPDNPVINIRSFGSNPEKVSQQVEAYIEGLQKSGCAAVVKHFPGHGNTSKDSHKVIPQIYSSIDEIRNFEFIPFVSAVKSGVSSVMTAHISYPKILGNGEPATFSKYFLDTVLRNEMSFDGLIFTDDLEMGAVSQNMSIGQAAVRAVISGADIVLVTTSNADKIFYALYDAVKTGKIDEKRINASVGRILRVKQKYCVQNIALIESDFIEADKINAEISEKALYLHKTDGTEIETSGKPLIVSDNYSFSALFEKDKYDIITIKSFYSGFKNNNRRIYIYSQNCTGSLIKKIRQESQHNHVTLIYSGNPYLFSKIDFIPETLFTFSNTNASLNAALKYIRGELKPKNNSPINFGFK